MFRFPKMDFRLIVKASACGATFHTDRHGLRARMLHVSYARLRANRQFNEDRQGRFPGFQIYFPRVRNLLAGVFTDNS